MAKRELSDFLYRDHSLDLLVSSDLGLCQKPGESRESFFARLQAASVDGLDQALDDLASRYDKKIARLEDRLRSKELAVAERQEIASSRDREAWLSLGESVLGMVLGRRRPRISTTMSRHRMSASAQQRLDRALAEAEDVRGAIAEMKRQAEKESSEVKERWKRRAQTNEVLSVKPRRSDIEIDFIGIIWQPIVGD